MEFALAEALVAAGSIVAGVIALGVTGLAYADREGIWRWLFTCALFPIGSGALLLLRLLA